MLDKTYTNPRHEEAGYYALADLPQRDSVDNITMSTGWWELDQIFKLYPGQFVVVTGIPGHGKSTLLLNIICNLWKDRVKSFLYVPENEGHIREKLALMWQNTALEFDVFSEIGCFVQCSVPDTFDQIPHTLDWLLNKAATAVERDGVKVLLIDPWNEIEHAKPPTMAMTDYIRQCIMWIKQFCRMYSVTVIMVAHPTKAGVSEGKTPGLADIEGCYTDDTEVLTRRGWLHHSQITLSDDVACFDPETSSVVYAQPSNVLRKEFDGEIHRFSGNGYDLAVTPQHRMLVKPEWDESVGSGKGRPVRFPKGKWSFCRAHDLPRSQFVLPLAGNAIGGADPRQITIGSREYTIEAFLRLAGWFVAEGHCGPTGLTWSQAKGDLADAFTAAFSEVGIPATVAWQDPHGKGKLVTGRWYVGNRFCPELVAWFKANCGQGAANKRIPAAIFDLSPRLKRVFLDAYIEGDGSSDSAGFTATTISRGLRDDLQRLAVELGLPTSFGTRPASGNNQEIYWIRFGAENRREVSMRSHRNLTMEKYSGLVWCLTVPTGAYFVRRNGSVTACGNSMSWYNKCDNGLIVVRDPVNSSCKVISAKVREIGAGKRGACFFQVDPNTGIFTPEVGAVG